MGQPGNPSASVVIATCRRPELLRRCLEGVAAQEHEPAQVIVVDNAPGEPWTHEIALQAGARYIREPVRGMARARNRGARASTAAIVAYLDDDAVPEDGWLSALVVEFADPVVAAVSGRVLPLDASGSGTIFGGPERIVLDRSSPGWFERATFGGMGQGANLAVRRGVLETWPGFDERLGAGTRGLGMEEHHAFFSLIDCGYRVVYTPAARVQHPFPRAQRDFRARHLTQVRAASFLVALLLAEEPRYRRPAAKYALQALSGATRPWRAGMGPSAPSVSRSSVLGAYLGGVALYISTRLDARRRSRRVQRAAV